MLNILQCIGQPFPNPNKELTKMLLMPKPCWELTVLTALTRFICNKFFLVVVSPHSLWPPVSGDGPSPPIPGPHSF